MKGHDMSWSRNGFKAPCQVVVTCFLSALQHIDGPHCIDPQGHGIASEISEYLDGFGGYRPPACDVSLILDELQGQFAIC